MPKEIIPTAEEFLKEKLNEESFYILKKYFDTSIEEKMIEFTKLHVEAALKEEYDDSIAMSVSKKIILNNYLEKIK